MGLQPGVFRPQRWRRQGLNAPRVEALFPSPPIFRWAGYFLARTCSTSLDLEVPQRSKLIRCLWRNESFNRARSCVLNESNYDGQSSENHQSPESRSRSEEHTSELQSLMRNSNDVLCLKNKTKKKKNKERL